MSAGPKFGDVQIKNFVMILVEVVLTTKQTMKAILSLRK